VKQAARFRRPVDRVVLPVRLAISEPDLGYSYKLNQSVAALFPERSLHSAYLSGVTGGSVLFTRRADTVADSGRPTVGLTTSAEAPDCRDLHTTGDDR
jgi:hypothetical protein